MRSLFVIAFSLLLAGCNSCGSATPSADSVPGASSPGKASAALRDPALAKEQAPAKYRAKFTTTKGAFVVEVDRSLAPNGADRFYNLVKAGFFDGTKFFRVVDGFMVQWGIHGDPSVAKAWVDANIQDD